MNQVRAKVMTVMTWVRHAGLTNKNTEGASLEIRRNQAKLSGKRTLFLSPLESPHRTPTVQIPATG